MPKSYLLLVIYKTHSYLSLFFNITYRIFIIWYLNFVDYLFSILFLSIRKEIRKLNNKIGFLLKKNIYTYLRYFFKMNSKLINCSKKYEQNV